MNGKIFSNVKMLALIAIVVAALSGSAFMLNDNQEPEILAYDGQARAVIIDQLYSFVPSEQFHSKATEILEAAGYSVDIFTTEDITVDFYKNLPSMNYNYIIIRSHGADDKSKESVALFTGEKYQEDRYISEQLFGQVAKGAPLQTTVFYKSNDDLEWNIVNDTYRETISPYVNEQIDPFLTEQRTDEAFFLITPKMVDELMVGKFPSSTIVIGGCDSLSNTSFAQALIDRGASSVVGWDGTIGSTVNDLIMIDFLEDTLIDGMEDAEATNNIMENNFWWNESPFPAKLKHFPE